MKINAYVAVFGIVAVVIAAAAISTVVLTQGQGQSGGAVSNLPDLGKAADFQGIAGWINSPPLNISELRGKVVLIDFWTYSCINCIRTIPYLNAWYSKYGNDGLVIVGVETPEFQFEGNFTNVLTAVKSFGIKYPVAIDNNDDTWNAYNNHYWPADYLIDKNGDVRLIQIGEGDYNSTEASIRVLLQEAGYTLNSGIIANSVNATKVNFAEIGTPELYVGYGTARSPIGNAQGFSPDQVVNYTLDGPLQNSTAYFSGAWYNAQDGMIAAGNNSKVYLVYDAKVVNIVAQGNSSTISAELDGRNLSPAYLGTDMGLKGGLASTTVSMARLYNIVNGPSYGWHELVITAGPGFKLYTFTFG
ncbi:MAG TPA: redoxin domain-containing protein [Nitrososphaerales archaeon]|nr:redoxin domain-containing protein [Nitrososphaerales archaeon]